MGEPALVSVPCRNDAHARCQVPTNCACECHDDPRLRGAKRSRFAEVGLKWEEPPGVKRRRVPLADRVRPLIVELRRHPGKWARLIVYAGKTGSGAANARQLLNRTEEFADIEFTARSMDGGGSALYGRYLETE